MVTAAAPGAKRPGRPSAPELTERRRREILDEAVRVFAGKGYAGADLQEVAEALGVGKGTIYRYFPSKEALFLAAVDRGMTEMSERINAAADAAADPLDKISAAIAAYLAYFDKHPEQVELFVQERAVFKDRKKPTYFIHREANIGRWRALLAELIRAGRLREVPVERLTDVVNDLLYGTIFTNHFAGRRKSFKRQTADILDILFNGILPSPRKAPR